MVRNFNCIFFQQRNLKQRFIALLKRFKVPEALQAFEQDQELDPRTGILSGQDHFYFGRQEFCLVM